MVGNHCAGTTKLGYGYRPKPDLLRKVKVSRLLIRSFIHSLKTDFIVPL